MRAYELVESLGGNFVAKHYGGTSRSIALSEEQAKELLNTKCSQMFANKLGIFRGSYSTEGETYVLTDPTKGAPRRAANTNNYMNLVMSNMGSWAHYPRRDRSLICATTSYNADNYGTVYRVYPFDGSLIGMCPSVDLWAAFEQTLKMGVDDLCSTIDGAYTQLFNKDMEEENYQLFMQQLAQLSTKLEAMDEEQLGKIFWDDFLKALKKHGSLLAMVQACTPEANGFKLMDTSSYKFTKDSEVWVGGPCVLVEEEITKDEEWLERMS